MELEIDKSLAIQILENEIATIKANIYRVEVNLRVNKKIGTDEQQLETLKKEMTRLEMLADEYQKEVELLKDEKV